MKNQISHLVQMAERPNITIQVVPAGTGAYRGLAGPFTILTIENDADAVYVTGADIGPIFEEPSKVEKYRLRFDLLRASALSVEDSLKLIQTILENT